MQVINHKKCVKKKETEIEDLKRFYYLLFVPCIRYSSLLQSPLNSKKYIRFPKRSNQKRKIARFVRGTFNKNTFTVEDGFLVITWRNSKLRTPTFLRDEQYDFDDKFFSLPYE
jgi:hypothetical protein